MNLLGYICCFVFGCFQVFCYEDDESGRSSYSITNVIRSNPELCLQMLDDHIINTKTKAKSAEVRIFAESVTEIPINNNNKVTSSKKKNRKIKSKNVVADNNIKCVNQRDNCVYSAFLISTDGYMVTNYSLLKKFTNFYMETTVKEKNKDVVKKVKLDVIGYDEYLDIMILKANIKTTNNLTIGGYSNSKVLRYVYCICGENCKLSGCTEIKFKNVKNKKNYKEDDNVKKINCYSNCYDYLSPCVLVDINGFFVGMKVNCGKFAGNKFCGYNSIIPFNDLKKCINDIKSKKYNSFEYDCFDLVSVDTRLKNIKRLSSNYGCYIDKVTPRVAKSGLNVGDVIIAINGTVISGIASFDNIFPYIKNDDITFLVSRNNGKNVEVKISSGILSDVKYDIINENTLNINGATLVNLNDIQINLLKSKSSVASGVLVSEVKDINNWKCGSNFVITNIYGKYKISSVSDIVNIFKNINNYVTKSDISKRIPFIISGFYMNDPTKEASFVLDL